MHTHIYTPIIEACNVTLMSRAFLRTFDLMPCKIHYVMNILYPFTQGFCQYFYSLTHNAAACCRSRFLRQSNIHECECVCVFILLMGTNYLHHIYYVCISVYIYKHICACKYIFFYYIILCKQHKINFKCFTILTFVTFHIILSHTFVTFKHSLVHTHMITYRQSICIFSIRIEFQLLLNASLS